MGVVSGGIYRRSVVAAVVCMSRFGYFENFDVFACGRIRRWAFGVWGP